MGSSTFQFKQFTIQQDQCAMKVSTDGILLGAWADCTNVVDVLDVGAGTGILSLMIAQRNSKAIIEAIELEPLAANQCKENFKNSPWPKRLKVHQGDFLKTKCTKKYDLILCNPPYFINGLKSENEQRKLARHDDCLPLEKLITKSISILSDLGAIALILPQDSLLFIEKLLKVSTLNIVKICHVQSHKTSKSKRLLITLSKEQRQETDKLIIYNNVHCEYSEDFKSLCDKFYLNL